MPVPVTVLPTEIDGVYVTEAEVRLAVVAVLSVTVVPVTDTTVMPEAMPVVADTVLPTTMDEAAVLLVTVTDVLP